MDENKRSFITNIVYAVLLLIFVVLGFRIIFKIFGADPTAPIVAVMYALAAILKAPFVSIFDRLQLPGNAAVDIVAFTALVSYLVIALALSGILRLIKNALN